jgi:Xaa-Pro aminopeptidase
VNLVRMHGNQKPIARLGRMPMPRPLLYAGVLFAVAAPGPMAAQAGSPAGAVPVELLAARRAALIARLESGAAILRGAEELPDDPPNSVYPQAAGFRQDNDFFYLTGLETPRAWLIVTARDSAHGDVHLFLPPRDPGTERWTGPQLAPGAEAAAATGIAAANIHPADSVQFYLPRLVFQSAGAGRPPTLWFRHDQRDTRPEFVRDLALEGRGVATRDLLPVLGQLRVIKDRDEIRRLTRAVEISAEGHVAAMRFARPGVWEYEIEAVAEQTFRRLGAERLAYPSIVGSGINSTVLHYDQNRRQTLAGDLVVMDMAAEFGYYAADVTRTIPVSGKFTPRQRAIYDLVLGAQQAAMDAVKPGVTLRELDGIARNYISEHSGTLCGEGGCARFFIHSLSHWIGMDVHDVGGGGVLVPGMAFTIEPGIYLPEEALGVRIEDDILVTAEGYELLSRRAPRSAEEIEKLMAGKR